MGPTYLARELHIEAEAVKDFFLAAEALKADRQNEALKTRVAHAAGRANRAAEMSGFYVEHRDPPVSGGRAMAFDPIANWNAQIDPFVDQLRIASDAALQILGILEAKELQALREEKSLVGRVARFVGFPARVRQHLAERGFSVAIQRAGFVTSVVGQIALGVIASLLATGLVWAVAKWLT